MNHYPQPARLLAAALLALTAMVGCQSGRATNLDPQTVEHLANLTYPKDAAYGPDLDIVVTNSRLQLIISNRTARTYANRQLWLNRQYAWEIERVEIGGGNRIPLTNFINLHAEPFPTPGFLRPERAAPIVLAELYDPATQTRNRLLVQTIEGRGTGVEGQEF